MTSRKPSFFDRSCAKNRAAGSTGKYRIRRKEIGAFFNNMEDYRKFLAKDGNDICPQKSVREDVDFLSHDPAILVRGLWSSSS